MPTMTEEVPPAPQVEPQTNTSKQFTYLPKNDAKYLAGVIIFEMDFNRRRLSSETGNTRMVNEHREEQFFEGHPLNLFGQHEVRLISAAAQLQAEILDKVEHPHDEAYEDILQHIRQVAHTYGTEILDAAISNARVAEQAKSPIPIPLTEERATPPKKTGQLEHLIIAIYDVKQEVNPFEGARRFVYTLASEEYLVPTTDLPNIPRPLTIALTTEHQRARINKEASLDITLEKADKAKKKGLTTGEKEQLRTKTTLALDKLLSDRTAQFYIQQHAQRLASTRPAQEETP